MTETASAPAPRRRIKTLLALVAALCLAVGGGAYWYKDKTAAAKQNSGPKNRPVPVVVAEAKTRDVEVFFSGLGTVSPQSSVTIKSRVDGQLMQVLVREGQTVKAGELLLVIDSRPFQVQLAQAEGQLKRDSALLENARLDLKRYADLIAQGAIARQQLDTQQALVHQYEGTVATDRATADSARLQITYCRITAPFAGQVGLRQVDPGNMVRSSDSTGLLVVNQLSPINVLFTLPEDQLPTVLAKLRAGQKLRVDAYDREQTRKLAQGELASMDNQIDTGTGTVKLKASFANTQGELYPNQFVNAKLLVDVLKDAVVVPAAAVQRGQQGTYLYVVSAEGVASSRPVTVGESAEGLSVVLSGLAVGERVVLDGADRLRDGAPVEIKEPGDKGGGKPGEKPGDKSGAQAQNATSPATAAANATGAAPVASPPVAKPVAKPEAKPEAKPTAKTEAKSEAARPAAQMFGHKSAAQAVPQPAVNPAGKPAGKAEPNQAGNESKDQTGSEPKARP